jgi:hypothetical protein
MDTMSLLEDPQRALDPVLYLPEISFPDTITIIDCEETEDEQGHTIYPELDAPDADPDVVCLVLLPN